MRQSRDQQLRLNQHVLGNATKKLEPDEIASKPLSSLTEASLGAWRDRRPKDLAPATVQRITTDLRAALNLAAKKHRKDLPADLPAIIENGLAIGKTGAAVARPAQVLTDADLRRLIDAAHAVDSVDGWDGDLARLVIVLAATGARFSQIIRMKVADVQDNRLMVPVSNKGRGERRLLALRCESVRMLLPRCVPLLPVGKDTKSFCGGGIGLRDLDDG